jgi:hypothetical protein
MTRPLLFLLSLLPFCVFAQAQSRQLTVRFLAERSPQELGQVFMAFEDKRSDPFDLSSNHLSASLVPPGPSFTLRAIRPEVALAAITLPETGKSFIVLLIPAKEGGFKPVVIHSDDPAFKSGDVYFYNHTSKLVLGHVGTAKFSLEAAKGMVLRPSGARVENFYDVAFGVREDKGDRTMSRTRWPVDDKVRSYVFFFVNPVTQLIDFRAVDEFIPPPLAQPTRE